MGGLNASLRTWKTWRDQERKFTEIQGDHKTLGAFWVHRAACLLSPATRPGT